MNEPREQILISRIVDAEASNTEWREFETSAAQEPLLWKQLASLQYDHACLARALSTSNSLADAISLPEEEHYDFHAQPVIRFNRLGAWTGWAVAAMVAIVSWVQFNSISNPGMSPGGSSLQTAGLPIQSAGQAFQAYLEKGRETGQVVGELPDKLLVNTRPSLSGTGFEVIYLRQVMERATVPDLYQFSGQDEAGRPTLVRYEQPVRRSM